MFRFDSDFTSSEISQEDYTKSQPILDSLFELFRILHHSKEFNKISIVKQKIQVTAECIVWCLQMISLLWIPHLSIKNWRNDMALWEKIGYFRLDNVCAAFGIIDKCLCISVFGIFSIFFLTIILFFAIRYSIKIPRAAFYMLEKFTYLWLNLLCIPSLVLFSIFIKYNFWQQKSLVEYENNTSLADLEIETPWKACCILAILMCLFIIILNLRCDGEIRHSNPKNSIKARAHSKIEIHSGILTFLFPVLCSMLDEDYIVYLQVFAMISSFLLMMESIIYSPYFFVYTSIISIIRFFIFCWIAFLFILGDWFENALIITIFAIFLLPITIILIAIYAIRLHKEINKCIPVNIIGLKNKYELEKSLRYELCYGKAENKDQVIYIFETFFLSNTLCRDKLQVIWLANYCLFTLKNASLAKIKICKNNSISDLDLEANFQNYLSNKAINDSNSNESVVFERYHNKLTQIKSIDKKLCANLSTFWIEITSKQPKLFRLIKSVKSISDDIQFLNDEYKQLTTEFHSREGLTLYCSYLKNITCDYENYDKISYKLSTFDGYFSNFFKNMSCFDNSNGILIFSNEEVNFGEILFANPKVAESFLSPLKFIVGENIFSFIPLHYKQTIFENIKKITRYGSNTEINLGESFFLVLPNNSLLVCTGKALISSINNSLVIILIFKRNDNGYQTALISVEKNILCCTEEFTQAVGKLHYNLIGFSLGRIFPDIENVDLQQSIPYRLSMHKELILLLLSSESFGMKIPYILLMKNYAEFTEWKNKNQINLENENLTENNHRSVDILMPVCSNEIFATHKSEIDENINYLQDDNQLEIGRAKMLDSHLIVRDDEERSQNTENLTQNAFIHMVKISSRSINALHLVFVITILGMLTTNIVVLFYASYSINAVRDVNGPIILENLGESFMQLGLFSRLTSTFKAWGIDSIWQFSYNYFLTNIDNIEFFYSEMISLLNKQSLCSDQDFFIRKSIDLWNVNDGFYQEKASLLDVTSQFIQLGNDFIKKFNNSQDVSSEVSFFVLNGYNEAFRYCNQSINELIQCQKSGIIDYKNKIFVLLVSGIIVFALGICIMIPFCYSAIKNENILWNKVRKHAYRYYDELSQPCLERLSTIHLQHEVLANNEHQYKNDHHFRNFWKYLWRVCLFLIVTSTFCIINIVVFYEKLSEYLYYRPEFIENLLNSQILLSELNTWSTESALINSPASIEIQKAFPSSFSNTYTNLNDSISRISAVKKKMRDTKYSPILSDSFKEHYYEQDIGAYRAEHRLGCYEAGEYSIIEAEFISHFEAKYVDDWVKLVLELQDLDTDYDDLIDSVNKYSQSVIDQQMEIIIVGLVIFILGSCVLYFSLYLTFFIKEKQYLKKISAMLEIIPES